MGNNYCCSYNPKPGEDLLLEKNNITIQLKYHKYLTNGKNSKGDMALDASEGLVDESDLNGLTLDDRSVTDAADQRRDTQDIYDVNKYIHMNGLGSSPEKYYAEFHSVNPLKKRHFDKDINGRFSAQDFVPSRHSQLLSPDTGRFQTQQHYDDAVHSGLITENQVRVVMSANTKGKHSSGRQPFDNSTERGTDISMSKKNFLSPPNQSKGQKKQSAGSGYSLAHQRQRSHYQLQPYGTQAPGSLYGSNRGGAAQLKHSPVKASYLRASELSQNSAGKKPSYQEIKQKLLSQDLYLQNKSKQESFNNGRLTHSQSVLHMNNEHHGQQSARGTQRKDDAMTSPERGRIYAVRAKTGDGTIISKSLKLVDIPKVLAKSFDSLHDDTLLYEGNLMKYKPGIKHQYISRWCQVTKTHFLYFGEGLPYASVTQRPLIAIPISMIDSVRRVCVDVPVGDKKNAEMLANLKNYQFEIFLKRSGSPSKVGKYQSMIVGGSPIKFNEGQSYISPLMKEDINRKAIEVLNADDSPYANDGASSSKKNRPKRSVSIKEPLKDEEPENATSPERSSRPRQQSNYLDLPNQVDIRRQSNQQLFVAEHSRISFHTNASPDLDSAYAGIVPDERSHKIYQSHQSLSFHNFDGSAVSKHLMPKPSPRKLSRSRENSQSPERLNSRNQSILKQSIDQAPFQKSFIKQEEIRKQTNSFIINEIQKHVSDKLQQAYLMSLIEESLSKPNEIDQIFVRNPSAWIKSLSSNFTWTNRELEWYFAEDRFLFAANSVNAEEDCDKWVCIMNWLLAKRADDELREENELEVEVVEQDDI